MTSLNHFTFSPSMIRSRNKYTNLYTLLYQLCVHSLFFPCAFADTHPQTLLPSRADLPSHWPCMLQLCLLIPHKFASNEILLFALSHVASPQAIVPRSHVYMRRAVSAALSFAASPFAVSSSLDCIPYAVAFVSAPTPSGSGSALLDALVLLQMSLRPTLGRSV